MSWSGQALRFDFVDLRLFANIAETESLSRGSERSNISLAAASTRVKNLELNLGVKLFDRRNRGVTLTPAGEVMSAHVRKVLQQVDEMQVDLSHYSSGRRGHVRVASNVTCLAELVPDAMRTFLASFPEVDVELLYYRSRDGLRALTEGEVDLALVAVPVREPAIDVVPLGTDRTVLIVDEDHPLAGRASVKFAELIDYDLVGLGAARTAQFLRMAKQMKRTLSFRIHVSEYEELCKLVSDGVGAAVVPRAIAAKYASQMKISIVDICERWADHELNLCLRRETTLPQHVQSLAELIEQAARDNNAQISRPGVTLLAVAGPGEAAAGL